MYLKYLNISKNRKLDNLKYCVLYDTHCNYQYGYFDIIIVTALILCGNEQL